MHFVCVIVDFRAKGNGNFGNLTSVLCLQFPVIFLPIR